ncbi:hypothetical protein V1264_018247 [Littorina saxatilis]|uniref:Uncharacterized protein n=1 Tax=Littorina saxatilis TaxID=31220 RepID=A0AAN9GCL3_9CAEN
MEEKDTAVVSDVKIEIDVAEETLQCWHLPEPQSAVPEAEREAVTTENTVTVPAVQTLHGQSAVRPNSDSWLKQEVQTPETQTVVVKMEIDVAEETLPCWHLTEPQSAGKASRTPQT